MDDREQQIRERAHALWEEQGCPEGRDAEHWQQAQAELTADIETPPPTANGLPPADAVSAISLDPVDQHAPTPIEPEPARLKKPRNNKATA
jgi:hypothetical protein